MNYFFLFHKLQINFLLFNAWLKYNKIGILIDLLIIILKCIIINTTCTRLLNTFAVITLSQFMKSAQRCLFFLVSPLLRIYLFLVLRTHNIFTLPIITIIKFKFIYLLFIFLRSWELILLKSWSRFEILTMAVIYLRYFYQGFNYLLNIRCSLGFVYLICNLMLSINILVIFSLLLTYVLGNLSFPKVL